MKVKVKSGFGAIIYGLLLGALLFGLVLVVAIGLVSGLML